MKFLKTFLGILVLLTLIFIGRGLLTPSINYTSETTVDKPIKEAWEVMQDESKITQWLEGIKDIKFVSGEKGTVGAVTEYTFVQNGAESTVIETIKAITPQKQIQMDFSAPGAMDMAYTVDYSTLDGKTLIKSTTDVVGQGFFMRCLIPWIKSSMTGQEDKNMANLKKLINENTTDYFLEPAMQIIEEG